MSWRLARSLNIRQLNARMVSLDERFTADKFGPGIEFCDLHPVKAKIQIVQPIPVKVVKEVHFDLPQTDAVDRVIPISGRSIGPWVLNQNWGILARRNYLEKRHGNFEDVGRRPLPPHFP